MSEKRAKTCLICDIPFEKGIRVIVCPTCQTMYHFACWQAHGGCAEASCPDCVAAVSPPTTAVPPAQATEEISAVSLPQEVITPAPAAVASPTTADDSTHYRKPKTPPTPPPPLDPAVEQLVREVHLKLRQGLTADVETQLAAAKTLAPEHPAVLEIEGDLAVERGRYAQAEPLYRKAFQADRGNARLEEKFATALVKMHESEYLAHDVPDDSPWSNRVKRIPAASGMMSFVVPGLGQFHNGDWLKGAIMIGAWVFLFLFDCWPVFTTLRVFKETSRTYSTADIVASLFHGPYLLVTILIIAVWLYGIIDAVLVARNME